MTPMIDSLKRRTPRDFKQAHVAHTSDFWCLDLDLHGETEAAVTQAIIDKAATLPPDGVLQGAPPEAWALIVGGTVEHVFLTRCPGARFNVLRIVVVKPK